MKHVHFTPPAPKKPKSTVVAKVIVRPEDIPLPRSRSNSPPVERPSRRERKNSVSQSQSSNYVEHRPQKAPKALANGSLSKETSQDSFDYSEQTRLSPTRISKPRSSINNSQHLDIPTDYLHRSHSIESAARPPSTIMVSSEEPPTLPSRKGKERAIDDDSFSRSDESSEDKLRIQLLEAEVERLRAEVC